MILYIYYSREKTVEGVKQNPYIESLLSPGPTLWPIPHFVGGPAEDMKTIIQRACGSFMCANIKILRHRISVHALVFEGCCSYQLFWCQLYLCAYKWTMEGWDGETESGSAAPDTPEKISRGLHPTSTTTAREEKGERGLTLPLFLVWKKNIRTKHSRGT